MSIKKINLEKQNFYGGDSSRSYFFKALLSLSLNTFSGRIAFSVTGSKLVATACSYIVGQACPKVFGGGLFDLLNEGYEEFVENENGDQLLFGAEELANGELGFPDTYSNDNN